MTAPAPAPADKARSLLELCRDQGLRRTALLERVLALFAGAQGPLGIGTLLGAEGVHECFDPATVYRMLGRLEAKGIIRRIGLHERAAHYILVYPGEHRDYVVCVECGAVEPLAMDCPVEAVEQMVSRTTGYRGLYHELQFYGVCPGCSR